ncbi:MAG: WYL domain-containing protein [Christensenellaceae bacterium]|nr:WYL domain-containing protein [Christensenellaceae bacterium]
MLLQQPKKLIILNILAILKKYTDEEHRLSQKEIADLLLSEYGMRVDRKSIRRNILNLIDCGYDIEFSEVKRSMTNNKTGEAEENSIMTDFYLVRTFTDAELRLLIDGLLFSKHIPYAQGREMIEKLESLSNQYFKSKVQYIRALSDNTPRNRQLFYTLEVLDEAISKGKQVSFLYNEYGTDKQLHPRKNAEGKIREYIINPYQIVTANGRYYLICNYDKYESAAHYRVDRITEIKLLETPVKPMRQVKGLEHGIDLPQHMAEHIYMYTGRSINAVFRMKKSAMNEVIDWFGNELEFFDETEEEVSARVRVNYEAMRRLAVQLSRNIWLLSPADLCEQVKEDLKNALTHYGK